mgnify:CR=1 FL=1
MIFRRAPALLFLLKKCRILLKNFTTEPPTASIPVPPRIITEIMGLLGFDFVIVDGEHTTFNPNLAEEHFRAAELRDISSVTRIGQNDQQVIQKFLDAGSQGVLMPLINNKTDAKSVVDSVKYPPVGKRGLASGRGSAYGIPQSVKEHVDSSNKETISLLRCHIFTKYPLSDNTFPKAPPQDPHPIKLILSKFFH